MEAERLFYSLMYVNAVPSDSLNYRFLPCGQ